MTGVSGVLDVGSLVTPTSTLVANGLNIPDNGTVGLLFSGSILIGKAH